MDFISYSGGKESLYTIYGWHIYTSYVKCFITILVTGGSKYDTNLNCIWNKGITLTCLIKQSV